MAKALQFVSEYSKQFDNFNDDLLINIRKNDKIVDYIDEMWKEVEKSIPDGNFKYLGYQFDDRGAVFKEINKGGKDDNSFKKTVSIYDTFARLAVFKFKIKGKNARTPEIISRYISVPIYIPECIDNYHYLIKGNRYCAPFQITDKIVYTNRSNMLVLKTLTRAIKMKKVKKVINDIHGESYHTNVFHIYITKKKVPFLLYYFAYYGVSNTIKYFGAESFIQFCKDPPPEPDEKLIFFKFGTIHIKVDRKEFNDNYCLRQFVATMLEIQKRNMDVNAISSVDRWKIILGNTLSTSNVNTMEKNEAFLRTFITSLDFRTMNNIHKLMGGFEKRTMFSVVRWMFFDFNVLVSKTDSLDNKRLRLGEYLVTPLTKTVYQKLYRYLSGTSKSRNIERCNDILKVSAEIITGAISGKNRSKALSLNIAKYSSYVNDNSVVSVAARFTKAGPGSPIEKSGDMISNKFRLFDPSYVGKVCLITTSNSEPGITGTLTPFTKIDKETLTFSKD